MYLEKLLMPINGFFAWLSGIAVAVMMLHVCIDVFAKFVLQSPIPATITVVTYYYMPLLTFLPLAFVQQKRGHISVEVFTSMWTILFCVVVLALLARVTFGEAVNKLELGTFRLEQNVRILTWPGQFFPAIGYGLLALLMMLQFIGYLMGKAPIENDSLTGEIDP
jgi:TRAP-type C4-dicarboxylate transport system permease small subunit